MTDTLNNSIMELEAAILPTESATGSALIADGFDSLARQLDSIGQQLDSLSIDIKYVVALLLILVVFETFRIVRGWSKGVGLK